MNSEPDGATRALSIGSVVGGVTPPTRVWADAIRGLMRKVTDADQGDDSGVFGVNVVFHVPGEVLDTEFSGERTGSYFKDSNVLMVQVAVPPEAPANLDAYLLSRVASAVALAEEWAQSRGLVEDLQETRDLVSSLEDQA